MHEVELSIPLHRYTLNGDQAVEAAIHRLVVDVAHVFRRLVPADLLKSLVVIGGYGRGEGGVEVRDGIAAPHNNIDFLLLTTRELSPTEQERLQKKIDSDIDPLRSYHGIGIDTSIVPVRKLESSPCLVIWYDMRHGHKPILGDLDYVRNLKQFSLENIEPWNVRDLLVNRGTLLVINRFLLNAAEIVGGSSIERIRRTVIKHGIKAIIGYGDALLFFQGKYDWSYAEKQRRMREFALASPSFKELYEGAMEFRFAPNYRKYLALDLQSWNERLLATLEPIHLEVESLRLSKRLSDWNDYHRLALAQEVWKDWHKPRELAKRMLNLARHHNEADGLPWDLRWHAAMAGRRRWIGMTFPAVAYQKASLGYQAFCQSLLKAKSLESSELNKAFLKTWGELGDSNFHHMLKQHGIELGEESLDNGGTCQQVPTDCCDSLSEKSEEQNEVTV